MLKRDFITQLILLLLLVLGLIGLRVWFFEPVTITDNMANNYIQSGDFIITVRKDRLKHGDFVLYTHEGKEYVSRVIAGEGDQVTYMDDVLYRNHEIVSETYLTKNLVDEYYTEDLTISTLTNSEYEVIPENSYLVLNDNRNNKEDSRTFGLINEEQIIGRLSFRLSPLSHFGFVDTGINR
ncbi:TPA: signal peptidase I [Streptococcus suis]|nr:signal peptidase I [Streptococcus suis]